MFLPVLNQFVAHMEDDVYREAGDQQPKLIHLADVDLGPAHRVKDEIAVDDGRLGNLAFHYAAAQDPQVWKSNRDGL